MWRLIRLAEHLPPPVRTSIYFRLFCLPLVHSRNAREVEILAHGEPFLVPSGDHLLKCWVFPAKGPCAVLCHGWQGSAASWATLISKLRDAGFQVVVFNAPGHHQRPARSSLPQFTDALSRVSAVFPPDVLIGHSFGAMTVARLLPELSSLRACVLYGTPNRLDALALNFCRKLALSESSQADFLTKLQTTLPRPLERECVEDYLDSSRVPLLMFHDREDDVVPIDCSRSVAQTLGIELVETEGLGHRQIIRDDTISTKTLNFLLKNLHFKPFP